MWEKVPKVQTINKVILSYNYKPMVQGGFYIIEIYFWDLLYTPLLEFAAMEDLAP